MILYYLKEPTVQHKDPAPQISIFPDYSVFFPHFKSGKNAENIWKNYGDNTEYESKNFYIWNCKINLNLPYNPPIFEIFELHRLRYFPNLSSNKGPCEMCQSYIFCSDTCINVYC